MLEFCDLLVHTFIVEPYRFPCERIFCCAHIFFSNVAESLKKIPSVLLASKYMRASSSEMCRLLINNSRIGTSSSAAFDDDEKSMNGFDVASVSLSAREPLNATVTSLEALILTLEDAAISNETGAFDPSLKAEIALVAKDGIVARSP